MSARLENERQDEAMESYLSIEAGAWLMENQCDGQTAEFALATKKQLELIHCTACYLIIRNSSFGSAWW